MFPELIGYITRREGRKFLNLNNQVDEGVLGGAGLKNLALYVHIPFCHSLCPFCCFNRYLFREDLARRYFKSLRRELELYLHKGYTFSSAYFGGGTPTILMDELLDLLAYLKKQFPIKQISLETNPQDLDPANVAALKQGGINRLSIGVQSFDREILKSMGRPPITGDELKRRLLLAQGHFDTLNIDLVFNFPGQSLDQFRVDVQTFKELGIDQVTFYPLMASPHKKSALERKFNRVDSSRERRFYEIILREVYDKGYIPSTAWCFSRGERMIDEYIIDYDDYIGVGAGSVSIAQDCFYVNSFSLARYSEMVDQERLPVIGYRQLSEKESLRYYMLTRLFGMRFNTALFRERFKIDIERKLTFELALLKAFGIVSGKAELVVTRQGMYTVSVMMREFFTALNSLREYCIEKQV